MTDHPLPFSPEDPRLSAYLLGEMEAAERSAFEAELKAHPAAQKLLSELRETSTLLQEVLEQEPAPALSPGQRSAILSAAAGAQSPISKEQPIMKKSHRLAAWSIVAAVAALSIAVAVWFNSGESNTPDERVALKTPAEGNEPAEFQWGLKEVLQSDSPDRMDLKDNSGSMLSQSESSRRNPEIAEGLGGQGRRLPGGAMQGQPKDESEKLAETRSPQLTPGRPGDDAAKKPASPLILSPRPGQPAPEANPIRLRIQNELSGQAKSAPAPGEKKPGEQVRAGGRVALSEESQLPGRSDKEKTRFRFEAIPGAEGENLKADFENLADAGGAVGDESYEALVENDFIVPKGELALSTFSIDVDTASYSNVRRFIQHGQRPPADAVRIEELVNYFHYDYAPPANGDPFSVHTEVAVCPWKPDHHLVRFGLKGREISKEQRPLSNLVFLVDVSGSMSSANKLPLVKTALTMLAGEMNENDRISIVTYAGNAAVSLPSTSGEHRSDIISAIQNLNAGGSTNGEGGIQLAYTEAIRHFIEDGSNRVILCTDGDFNVGISDDDQLVTLIQDKAKSSGVFLSIFGFGMGNLKDAKLEKLADKGNGHYAYIDNQREARKVFVEELTGTLYTIAKDVKIQVEFNPAHIGAYRLIGYENRILAAQDFNDDAKDAGEIGAGHTVTALYEVIPIDKMPAVAEGVDNLKYQPAPEAKNANEKPSPELLTLKLRYKKPDEDVSVKREYPVENPGQKAKEPTGDTEWQAAVAAYGMVLRNSKHKGEADLKLVRELALGSRGPDPTGRRREFIDLVLTTEKLATGQPLQPAPLPQALPAEEAQKAATVQGKYQKLLKTLAAPQDVGVYGAFNDYGYWEGKSYGEEDDLPKAHWVYVYPNWYLWGETAKEKD